MAATNDPIKALIETTGLSYDDLLQKLLQYKSEQNKNTEQAGTTASSNCGSVVENDVESIPVISEKSCSPSHSDNPKTTSNVGCNNDELEVSSNSCKADLRDNGSLHRHVSEVPAESNAEENHVESTPVISEKNCSPNRSDNPKTTSNVGSNNDELEVSSNSCNTDLSDNGSPHPPVPEESNAEENHVESSPVISEKSCSPSYSENPKTTSNVDCNSDELDVCSNSCNADLSDNESPHHHIPEVPEESNVSARSEVTTEIVSLAVERDKETSWVDLKNTPNEKGDVSKNNIECEETLSDNKDTSGVYLKNTTNEEKGDLKISIDVSKNNKECEETIRDNKVYDSNSEHSNEISNDPSLQNTDLCLGNTGSPLIGKENSLSPSKKEDKSDNGQSIPSNDSQNEKQTSSSYHSNSIMNNTDSYPSKRKSISDELVQKLSKRIDQHDEIVNENIQPEENDIEVCQIEEMENPTQPLLKLRSDLFANNFKGNFSVSDNEDENENTPEMKEFLKNIEEVTGEVKNIPSVKGPLQTTRKDVVKVGATKVRKVKMGFVKKRILHKAIKCMNGAEAKKTELVMRNERLYEPVKLRCKNEIANTSHVSEEQIRENLKLQLSSLRNRKKANLISNKCNIDNLIINYDKHTFDKKKATNTVTVPTDQAESSTIANDKPQSPVTNIPDETSTNNIDAETPEKESLFSLANDTDFVIVDVQGGVELSEIIDGEEKTKETPTDLIKLTKTNDVTKIKGWQNKKFQLQQEEHSKEFSEETNIQTQYDDSVSGCSQTKISEETQIGTKEELSPFVSNSLEEFLNENSTLNISYNIPKLGAVQGINNEKYDTLMIPHTSESDKKEKIEKPKSMKPKTLAEKRRMLENNKSKVKNNEKIINRKSYVLYNGHKLYVPSTNSEECLLKVNYTPKLNIPQEETNKIKNRKLSLLESYLQGCSVSYKPGPLREKCRLQDKESMSQWNTELRKLPPVKLKVALEAGKAIPPHLLHHFNFGPQIREDRLELALCALVNKSGEREKQGFSLTVPYAHKEKYTLVRKKKEIPDDVVVYDITPEKNTIESVLDDLISYVESKENENSIIKDAEVYEDKEKHEQVRTSTEVSPIKKVKRRKLDMEIMRLNCKVLSVSVDEAEETDPMCQKSFCKLGCICKSLACVPQLPMHCSKIECMFECKCSLSENISLGVEPGALTNDTVTRLEDQAKRNLARVEKEFTQTIIHANNKTILIPSTNRSKKKRVKRVPKRYSDFLEDFNEESSLNDNQDNHSKNVSNCYVELQKLDIKGIIPLCLYHGRYNCKCINSSIEKQNSTSENEGFELAQNRIDRKRKSSALKEKKNMSKKLKLANGVSNSNNNTSDSDHLEEYERREVDNRTKVKESCARFFGVPFEVIARNKIPYYKKKIKTKLMHTENIDTTDLKKYATYTEPFTEFIDVTTPLSIPAKIRLKLFQMRRPNPHKRKQAFDDVCITDKSFESSKQETPHEFANEACDGNEKTETVKAVFDGEIIVPTNENKDFVKKLGVKSAAPYMRLLPWNDLLRNYYSHKINIWCPNDNYNKLLMNITEVGPPEGYIEITKSKRKNGIMNWILTRELPQRTPSELVHLILSPKSEYFEISGICLKNISEEEKSKKIIDMKNDKVVLEPSKSVEHKNPPKDSMFFEHKNHNNQSKLLMMTLKEYNKQFLYVCTDLGHLDNDRCPLHVRLPTFESLRWRMLFLNSNFTFLSFEKSYYSIKYTDLMNLLKKAQASNKTICVQGLNLSKGYKRKNFGIYAVPNFVNSLFIGPYELDEDHGLQTLRYLRQELVSTKYFEMVQGGKYTHKTKDKWLVAKGFDANNANLKIKEKSRGNTPKTSKQIAENLEYAVLLPSSNSRNSSGENKTNPEFKNDTAQELHQFHSNLFDISGNFTTSMDLEEKAFIKFPQFTILNGKTFRPQDYNRYLTTNIPDFGYLGAVKDDATSEIEVHWPFGNKVLRFTKVEYAKQFIRRRFINLLLPVPTNFNLQVVVKSDVENLKKMSVVNPKYLNGTHICGSFGILDSRKLTPSLALTLGTTQEDVLQRLAKRAQFLVRSRLRTLGLFLLPNDEQLEEVLDNVAHLSKLGKVEIEKLQAQEKTLINTKKEMIMKKQTLLKKYMDLLMILPEEERLEQYAEFRKKFNSIPFNDAEDSNTPEGILLGNTELNNPFDVILSSNLETDIQSDNSKNTKEVIECIEIKDSDSEDEADLKTKEEKTSKKQTVMKSILKPNTVPQPSSSHHVEIESPRPMEKFKVIKSATGKLLLVKDTSGSPISRIPQGIKMKIKNNKILGDKT